MTDLFNSKRFQEAELATRLVTIEVALGIIASQDSKPTGEISPLWQALIDEKAKLQSQFDSTIAEEDYNQTLVMGAAFVKMEMGNALNQIATEHFDNEEAGEKIVNFFVKTFG